MMPLLPYFLVYLSEILAALPASQNFLFPYFLSLTTAITGAFLFARSRPNFPIKSIVLVLLFPLGFSAPGWQDQLRPEHHILNHLQEGQRAVVEGWVEEMPTVFPDKVRYRVHLEQITYKGSLLVRVTGTAHITLYQSENPFRMGDRLKSRLTGMKTVPLPLQPGQPWKVGEVRLTLLHPTPEFIAAASSHNRIGNDLSMVWKIEYGAFSMLLTGDITEKVERYLVEHDAPLQAGILKAPHHGSRTSSHPDFIRAVGPRDVIVSSGRFNVFHHPHPNIVDRYDQYGATLWRTDLQGAICITTDGTDTRITDHKDL
jgi:Domain of unknown function (DUF4131)